MVRLSTLSIIVHKDRAYSRGKILCERLRKTINRQQYDVAIQAAIGNKVISQRETVKALRKDVTAKCYGGDISRKRNCCRSKKRKKRMKQVGNVEVPQEAFLAILSTDQ